MNSEEIKEMEDRQHLIDNAPIKKPRATVDPSIIGCCFISMN